MASDWKHWVQAWETSGQSQKQFCLDSGLDYTQFKNWRQKAIGQGICKRRWSSSLDTRMSFSEVTVSPSHPAADIVLELPHGITLRIPSDVSSFTWPIVLRTCANQLIAWRYWLKITSIATQ